MINVAVIGIGNMGKNHARVYYELENTNLIAISDVDDKEGIAKKFHCKFYRDYHQMLEREDIDGVSIAVPTALHKKVALDCIEKKVHILVEKPLSNSLEDAEAIIEAAKSKKVKLMVGHIERFNPAVQRLRELLVQNKIGEPTSIIARRVGVFPPQIKDANVIIDLAVHDIDIFNFLLERNPVEVYAKAGRALDTEREDYAVLTLDYGGIPCVVQVNWITPVKIRTLAVTGIKGYAELNYITQELKIYESIYEKTHDSFGDFVFKFGSPREIRFEVEKKEPLKVELKHFAECVEKDKEPMVGGRDALNALKLALLSIKSYRENKPIRIE
jgi:UDP-N-acetylglucosamine 3-dehydrogenase